MNYIMALELKEFLQSLTTQYYSEDVFSSYLEALTCISQGYIEESASELTKTIYQYLIEKKVFGEKD